MDAQCGGGIVGQYGAKLRGQAVIQGVSVMFDVGGPAFGVT